MISAPNCRKVNLSPEWRLEVYNCCAFHMSGIYQVVFRHRNPFSLLPLFFFLVILIFMAIVPRVDLLPSFFSLLSDGSCQQRRCKRLRYDDDSWNFFGPLKLGVQAEGLPDLGFVPSMATYASSATQQQQQQPPGAESSSAADAAGGGGNANSSSASSSSKPQSARPQGRRSRKAPHELLTEAEKKANHIASEQKRRQNIRLGFDQLIEIVPSLSQGNRSEALILQKCKYNHSTHMQFIFC